MRILHVIESIKLANGGPPRVCLGLARALAVNGHEVTILTTTLSPEEARPVDETFVGGGSLAFVWCASVHELKRLGSVLVKHQQIVHFHDLWRLSMVSLAWACRASHTPYVVMPHGALDVWSMSQKSWKKRLFLQLFGNKALASAAAIHVLNDSELAGLRNAGITGRYFQLHNGIATEEWSELSPLGTFRRENPYYADKRIVLFMARYHHKKGPDILLDAFMSLRASYPDAALILAGPDDGMEAEMRTRVGAANAGAQVAMHGLLLGTARTSLLQDADIFVLPSHQEGHPLGILEAAYLGKTILMTPGCHCPELEACGGALVVSDDVPGVTAGLASLLGSPEQCVLLADQAQAYAREHYPWSQIAYRLAEIYRSLVGENSLGVTFDIAP